MDIQTDSGGKQKKGQMKKASTRVDFTPMVDMIMLLLTFFMLATTLSKPQTMEIAMPMKDSEKLADDKKSQAKASEAITFYLAEDNKVYYFEGKPDLETQNFLKETNYSNEGMRAILLNKNKKVVAQVNELKVKKLRLQIGQEEYSEQVKELKNSKGTPVVMIKPLDNATYDNLVTTLDEMLITNVGKYAITELDSNDKKMLDNSKIAYQKDNEKPTVKKK